jgi:hypothetical protein
MSSQKVVQTREEKLEAILPFVKEWIMLKCILSDWVIGLKEIHRDCYSAPEIKVDSLRRASDKIELIQRILSKRQDKFNTKLVQCIDVIAIELYENAVQKIDAGVLIRPVPLLFLHLRSENNISNLDTNIIEFTDAGLNLLSRFV